MIDPNAAGNVTIVLDTDEVDELVHFLTHHTRERDGVTPASGHTVACELLFRLKRSMGKGRPEYTTKDPGDDDVPTPESY
ncbi:MAG: hypothetical protein F4213_13755 [Boseongicola sp. SB0677_bin_26]|nr:hypothetical protein [Boseongicola sp. SB0665_bin_10]MYG27067.1 hypothetical protein [Boseongicola sp. SB0677_bin_26]